MKFTFYYISSYILLAIIIFLVILGLKSYWVEEERKKVKEKVKEECSKEIFFLPNPIFFDGFDFDEVDTVKIIEKRDSTILNTFHIYPKTKEPEFDEVFSANQYKQFNVNNRYEFYIGKEPKPYILFDIVMGIRSQYTEDGAGWGCEMNKFKIDTNNYGNSGIIFIKKRGKK